MSTPPLQTTVSVPFRWEEQPGKPLPCTDLIITGSQYNTTRPDKTHLDLPPRLAAVTPEANIVTKTSSPTTVLDGPGDVKTTKSVLSSFSFRFTTERRRRRKQRSFDSEGGGADEDGGGGGKRWLLVGDDGFGGFRSSSVRRDSSGLKVKRSRFLVRF
ncbi:hypothetical protein QVD17_33239 [Tagetes erecta]|uniref:Uncharacterized protein n=1 Tax=Tagetes erecta TaxID=13708 RepID=A0AAD8NDW2_TARER|nr:hypothetical protein QVD17_33239 [Tagetes erecta]